MSFMDEAEIREFLREQLGQRVAESVIDQIAWKWVNDRLAANEWVITDNAIIE